MYSGYSFKSSLKRRLFISFDWHHDRHYRYLLSALNANSRFDIEFDDGTPDEIQSTDISKVKAVLTTKIQAADIGLILVGRYANSAHPDRLKIGELNWQHWECRQCIARDKPLVIVKIEREYLAPAFVYNVGAQWINSFDVKDIANAIDRV